MLKKRIILSLWWLLAIAVTSLLIAAVREKKKVLCSNIKVEIEGNEGHVFLSEKEIADRLKVNGADIGKQTSGINLRALETMIKNQPWIQNAELYFDNNGVLQVKIKEREPIARIFTLAGASFYIDSSGMRLPLSPDYSAHVPMFTSFTSNKKRLSKPDSLLLNKVKNIALYIQQDSFWNAQVSQVIITPRSTFSIIPVIGNQTIKLGDADSLSSKFNRLFAFYKQVWAKAGFEKYETISAEFSGQIVATKRGAPKPVIDSALAYRIVSAMRTGIDILKDSSLMFHSIDAMKKTASDTALHQQVIPVASISNNNENNVVSNETSTLKKDEKLSGKKMLNQPKAMMTKPKSKQ